MSQIINDIKYAVINPSQVKDPKALSNVCKIGKIIAVALAVFTVAIAFFTGPIGFLISAPFAIALYDGYKVTDNMEEIADKLIAGKAVPSPKSAQEAAQNVGRGTIFAKSIMGLALPKSYYVKEENILS